MFEKYNEKARRALFFARYEASKLGSRVIETEHILLGVLREGEEVVTELLRGLGVRAADLRRRVEGDQVFVERISATAELPLSEESKKVLAFAGHEAESLGVDIVGSEHLLVGLLRVEDSFAAGVMRESGMNLTEIREELHRLTEERREADRGRDLPYLSEYGRDLTELAAEDSFDPLIGREEQLDRIIEVLSRRTKNNPILLGEPGVGKTAIVEGLAQRIADGLVPGFLQRRRIIALDLSLIVAGTKYRGQFEERLKGILSELLAHREFIVFIDEIHALVGAGSAEGSLDAANILKPALSRGEISCIGATTQKEYRKYIEKDRSLLRRFQSVRIEVPTPEETLEILKGIKSRYEQFHNVRYTDRALHSAIAQSSRYIPDRRQPDKAIDVLDEAGARVKLRRLRGSTAAFKLERQMGEVVREMKDAVSAKDFERAVELRAREIELREELDLVQEPQSAEQQTVTRADVEEVVAGWTGVPVATLQDDEAERLLTMEDILRRRVVGQDQAIEALSRAIRRSRLGVANPRRPVGSFIFLGPSGVGKTEVARQLAEFLFGSQQALVRFDMSEYMEKHTVSRLIGSPPGYVGHEEGGQLTERVRRQPYSLILFDEIEKAHPDVTNLLLQILDDGTLTDAYGNNVDFTNSLLLMTSNVGSQLVLRGGRMGFGEADAEQDFRRLREEIMGELNRTFRPEFINRVDEVVVFRPLGKEQLREIIDILIDEVNADLAERRLEVVVTQRAREWLLEKAGVDPSTGARPLRRTVQRHVQDAISEYLIEHRDEEVEVIEADVAVDELSVRPIQQTVGASPKV